MRPGERETQNWEELYEEFYPYVWKICSNYFKNQEDTHDAAQTVFAKAFAHRGQYNPEYPFNSWIARIANNHCIDILRRTHFDQPLDEAVIVPANNPLRFDDPQLLQLNLCLGQLPVEQKTVFLLKHIERYTWDEIPNMLDITPHQARYLEKKAKEALLQCIQSDSQKR